MDLTGGTGLAQRLGIPDLEGPSDFSAHAWLMPHRDIHITYTARLAWPGRSNVFFRNHGHVYSRPGMNRFQD